MPRLGTITRFNQRSSGRDLSAVRRPGIVGIDVPVPSTGDVKTERPAPEPKKNPAPKTTASKPAKNDASVKVKSGG